MAMLLKHGAKIELCNFPKKSKLIYCTKANSFSLLSWVSNFIILLKWRKKHTVGRYCAEKEEKDDDDDDDNNSNSSTNKLNLMYYSTNI